jgi:UDP-galactopyranose mutase
MMNKEWIGERVAVLDIDRALENVLLERDDFGWGPNNRFKYPLRGGTGEFYRRMAESLSDHLELGRTVASIDVDARVVTYGDGSREAYDTLISAMPLDVLCRDVLAGAPPPRAGCTSPRTTARSTGRPTSPTTPRT